MGRPPDTDEGVRAAGREVINRFDADRSLKAQIPELRIGALELDTWSWVSSPGVWARNTDDSWVFSADCLESVYASVYCAPALERKETAAFLFPFLQTCHLCDHLIECTYKIQLLICSSEDVSNNL